MIVNHRSHLCNLKLWSIKMRSYFWAQYLLYLREAAVYFARPCTLLVQTQSIGEFHNPVGPNVGTLPLRRVDYTATNPPLQWTLHHWPPPHLFPSGLLLLPFTFHSPSSWRLTWRFALRSSFLFTVGTYSYALHKKFRPDVVTKKQNFWIKWYKKAIY